MKTIILAALLLFASYGIAQAHTKAEWDRNVEADLAFYRVYVCVVKGCTVTQTPANLQATTVPQPAVGGVPTFMLPVGKEGSIAVSAVNAGSQESGLSVAVPFSSLIPPAVPKGVRLK